ncbi:hypothetical protein OW763_09555 [Clostridium aestuarii]|uniref:Uncharacterized protein n=1 Tax=Clostridium aestuarii TaxID=338193 RepID=A0ABT4D314_9CLOT|nr:hypothetical protein [Clostridium aestuarii]MCY6484585.1 hypothetical protein [Clostridium aestuarii]
MVNKLKKKKGSSLLMLLIFTSIISIIGMSMLSLSLSGYKIRKINSTTKRNFYASEAGIDEAYAIIGKDMEQAMFNAKDSVKTAMNNLNLEEEKLKVLNGEESNYINEDGSINEDEIKKFQDQVFKTTYMSYIESNIRDKVENKSEYKYSDNGEKPIVEVITSNKDLKFVNDKLDAVIKSSFTHEGIQKEIQVTYEISVPEEYNSVYYLESSMMNLKKNSVWTNSISIDGDMNVKKGSVNINGDVFVKGSNIGLKDGKRIPMDESIKDSGINLSNDSSRLTVNGDVITAENIYIASSNSTVNINGNAYTRNTIIDGGEDENISAGSVVNINKIGSGNSLKGKLYTLDDLELNSKQSQINISGGYFGVSDGSDNPEPDHSSSIIINADDIGTESSLTIGGELVIAGSSYINLYNGNKYQTGESVSIKGNYKAYTMPLINGNPKTTPRNGSMSKSLKEENIQFEYIEPLSLVERFKDGSKLNVLDKSDYFKAYAEDTDYSSDENNKLNLASDGLNIKGNVIYNAGAIIKNLNNSDIINNVIQGSNPINASKHREVNEELKRKIYYMGYEQNEEHVFNTNELKVQVNGNSNASGKVQFNNIVKTKIKNTNGDSVNSDIASDDNILVLDGSDKDYAFVNKNVTDKSGIPNDAEQIKINSNGEFKGIIVVKGTIYLCGKLNFKGTIICGGNLEFVDSEEKTINYDEMYVSKMIAYNYSKFKNVFKNNLDDSIKIESDLNISTDDIGTDVLRDKYIKRKKWELIK